MTSLCLVSTRHFMVNRRLVTRNGKRWVCYRATPHGHNFHQKGNLCGFVSAVRWLLLGEAPK